HRLSEGLYSIRWFTPMVEAPLCGHATLAAAHAVWSLGVAELLTFESQSGRLTAMPKGKSIELDFPSEPCRRLESVPPILEAQFGAMMRFAGQNRLDYVVELKSAEAVQSYQPDFTKLAQLGRGLMITARSDSPGFDFVSRVFAPSEGIPEDPVT